MGLKGYMLWVMGQLNSNVQSPTAREQLGQQPVQHLELPRGVALQVEI
jgi:hypothetical protein